MIISRQMRDKKTLLMNGFGLMQRNMSQFGIPNLVEEEIKLDFNDVLFKPKKSSLKSRSEVSLE